MRERTVAERKETAAMRQRTIGMRKNLDGVHAETVRSPIHTVRSAAHSRCLSSSTVRFPGETVYLAAELGRQSRESKMPRLYFLRMTLGALDPEPALRPV
jgi:hypothetical protein